jgi:hypothetical protein
MHLEFEYVLKFTTEGQATRVCRAVSRAAPRPVVIANLCIDVTHSTRMRLWVDTVTSLRSGRTKHREGKLVSILDTREQQPRE